MVQYSLSNYGTAHMEIKKPRILIGIPSACMWEPKFGLSLAMLVSHLQQNVSYGFYQGFHFNMAMGSNIARLRDDMLRKAVEDDFTHLFMVDDDMVFPPNIIARLLSHGKDVIAVNGFTKNFERPHFLAWDDNSERIDSYGKTGIEQVNRVGTGIMLIDAKAVKDIPHPRFWRKNDGPIGEDYSFCLNCKDHGIEVWIDHDLSNEIGHIGEHEYTAEQIHKFSKA